MANRHSGQVEITPGGPAQGLCLRDLPDGGRCRRSDALLDRAGEARHHSAHRVPPSGAARAHGAHDAASSCTSIATSRRSIAGCAEPRRRPHAAPGSMPAFARSIVGSTSAVIATASRSMTATTLVGGLYGVSLGARVLRREHVPPRARCLEDRAGASGRAAQGRRLSPARHPVRHRPSARPSARYEVPRAAISPPARRRAEGRRPLRRAAARASRSTAQRRSKFGGAA